MCTWVLFAVHFPNGTGGRWIIAIGVLVGAFLLSRLISQVVAKQLGKSGASERSKSLAVPASRFATTLLITGGLLAAIGIVSPASLAPFPQQIIQFVPRLLIAVLLLLVGSTVGTIAGNVVGLAAVKSTGKPQPALARLTRTIVLVFVGLLAVGQLGVDTRIIDTLTQAVLFSLAAMLALLGVFGGRDLASAISSGRYLRRIIQPGDFVETTSSSGQLSGAVRKLHAATVELEVDDETSVHVPNHLLLEAPLRVRSTQRRDPE